MAAPRPQRRFQAATAMRDEDSFSEEDSASSHWLSASSVTAVSQSEISASTVVTEVSSVAVVEPVEEKPRIYPRPPDGYPPETIRAVNAGDYSGDYIILQKSLESRKRCPIWRHLEIPAWLFCAPSGRWMIGDEEEEAEDFNTNTGGAGTKAPHRGTWPQELRAESWLLFDFNDESWTDAPDMMIFEVGPDGNALDPRWKQEEDRKAEEKRLAKERAEKAKEDAKAAKKKEKEEARKAAEAELEEKMKEIQQAAATGAPPPPPPPKAAAPAPEPARQEVLKNLAQSRVSTLQPVDMDLKHLEESGSDWLGSEGSESGREDQRQMLLQGPAVPASVPEEKPPPEPPPQQQLQQRPSPVPKQDLLHLAPAKEPALAPTHPSPFDPPPAEPEPAKVHPQAALRPDQEVPEEVAPPPPAPPAPAEQPPAPPSMPAQQEPPPPQWPVQQRQNEQPQQPQRPPGLPYHPQDTWNVSPAAWSEDTIPGWPRSGLASPAESLPEQRPTTSWVEEPSGMRKDVIYGDRLKIGPAVTAERRMSSARSAYPRITGSKELRKQLQQFETLENLKALELMGMKRGDDWRLQFLGARAFKIWAHFTHIKHEARAHIISKHRVSQEHKFYTTVLRRWFGIALDARRVKAKDQLMNEQVLYIQSAFRGVLLRYDIQCMREEFRVKEATKRTLQFKRERDEIAVQELQAAFRRILLAQRARDYWLGRRKHTPPKPSAAEMREKTRAELKKKQALQDKALEEVQNRIRGVLGRKNTANRKASQDREQRKKEVKAEAERIRKIREKEEKKKALDQEKARRQNMTAQQAKERSAALKIQGAWRAYKARRRVKDIKAGKERDRKKDERQRKLDEKQRKKDDEQRRIVEEKKAKERAILEEQMRKQKAIEDEERQAREAQERLERQRQEELEEAERKRQARRRREEEEERLEAEAAERRRQLQEEALREEARQAELARQEAERQAEIRRREEELRLQEEERQAEIRRREEELRRQEEERQAEIRRQEEEKQEAIRKKKEMSERRKAAVKLQCWWRGILGRRSLHKRRKEKKKRDEQRERERLEREKMEFQLMINEARMRRKSQASEAAENMAESQQLLQDLARSREREEAEQQRDQEEAEASPLLLALKAESAADEDDVDLDDSAAGRFPASTEGSDVPRFGLPSGEQRAGGSGGFAARVEATRYSGGLMTSPRFAAADRRNAFAKATITAAGSTSGLARSGPCPAGGGAPSNIAGAPPTASLRDAGGANAGGRVWERPYQNAGAFGRQGAGPGGARDVSPRGAGGPQGAGPAGPSLGTAVHGRGWIQARSAMQDRRLAGQGGQAAAAATDLFAQGGFRGAPGASSSAGRMPR